MSVTTLVLIASIGLAYVGLGVWAITLIFPRPSGHVGAARHPHRSPRYDHS